MSRRTKRAADNLGAAKLRILREAVRHNVEVARRVRTKRAPGSPPLPLWIAGWLLVAALVYLSLPAKAGNPVTGRAEAPMPAKDRGAPSEAPQAAEAPQAIEAPQAAGVPQTVEAPQTAPRRLARAVLPLPIKRIVLDPGHGGAQAGTVSVSGASEKEITLDLALRLRRLLLDASFEVFLTREADATMSLEQRVAFANARRADVFVSIHVNWISRRDVRPVETYHVGPTDDPAVLKLAGAENRESGYSLGAYRQLLEKIYIDERRGESRAFAGAINTELYRALSAVNPGLANRGVKMAPFAVLVGTEMPAILVEVSCLSNEKEAQLLMTDDYRARIAVALLEGIRSYSRQLDGVAKKEG
jgi:N-acetylmuramoyl-L-alanine amidase